VARYQPLHLHFQALRMYATPGVLDIFGSTIIWGTNTFFKEDVSLPILPHVDVRPAASAYSVDP
jgi:hypothetical protein